MTEEDHGRFRRYLQACDKIRENPIYTRCLASEIEYRMVRLGEAQIICIRNVDHQAAVALGVAIRLVYGDDQMAHFHRVRGLVARWGNEQQREAAKALKQAYRRVVDGHHHNFTRIVDGKEEELGNKEIFETWLNAEVVHQDLSREELAEDMKAENQEELAYHVNRICWLFIFPILELGRVVAEMSGQPMPAPVRVPPPPRDPRMPRGDFPIQILTRSPKQP